MNAEKDEDENLFSGLFGYAETSGEPSAVRVQDGPLASGPAAYVFGAATLLGRHRSIESSSESSVLCSRRGRPRCRGVAFLPEPPCRSRSLSLEVSDVPRKGGAFRVLRRCSKALKKSREETKAAKAEFHEYKAKHTG